MTTFPKISQNQLFPHSYSTTHLQNTVYLIRSTFFPLFFKSVKNTLKKDDGKFVHFYRTWTIKWTNNHSKHSWLNPAVLQTKGDSTQYYKVWLLYFFVIIIANLEFQGFLVCLSQLSIYIEANNCIWNSFFLL